MEWKVQRMLVFLHYLCLARIEVRSGFDGEAAQVIASLTNYNIETSLKERFDNQPLNAPFSIPSIAKESFVPLRKLLDQSTEHLQSLASINRPLGKRFDDEIAHIITSKLEHDTRRQWEALVGFNEFPDWEKLKIFLTNKFNVLEVESLSTVKLEKADKVAKPVSKQNFIWQYLHVNNRSVVIVVKVI